MSSSTAFRVPNVDCRYGLQTEIPKKIFSAQNDQGSMKRREKWFSEKILTLKIFGPSHSRYVLHTSKGRAPASEFRPCIVKPKGEP